MSELKEVKFHEMNAIKLGLRNDKLYFKSEADKVIAEKDAEIERLEILCATYRHDCDNLAISNEQAKRAARTLLKKMNYNKYKRCLAMANFCFTKSLFLRYVLADRIQNGENYISANNWRINLYEKWCDRWKKLAEKFKEDV